MQKIRITILIAVLFALGSGIASAQSSDKKDSGNKITVWTIGDSTMANKKAEVFPETGWGMALSQFFDDQVIVKNRAMNGRSSKSFISEGRWKAVLDSLHKGDYVFIQFGHNDEKYKDTTRYTKPFTTFAANLERFVRETREKGAFPILFTPIVRRKFVDGFLTDTHGKYPAATRQVAEQWNVPLVDLQYLTAGAVTAMGDEASKAIYDWSGPTELFPKGRKDDTHLKVKGARLVAKLAAQQLILLDNSLARHIRSK